MLGHKAHSAGWAVVLVQTGASFVFRVLVVLGRGGLAQGRPSPWHRPPELKRIANVRL